MMSRENRSETSWDMTATDAPEGAAALPDSRFEHTPAKENYRLRSLYRYVFCRTVQWIGSRILGPRACTGTPDPSRVRRVLVIRLDGIGDVVLNTPLLRELRLLFPQAKLTLVVLQGCLSLMETCPYVDRVLGYTAKTPRFGKRLWRVVRHLLYARRHFWAGDFDLAIVPRFDTDDDDVAYLAYFSRAKWRLAYAESATPRKRQLDRGKDALFTHILDSSGTKHEVERNLDVVRFLGARAPGSELELWATQEDYASVRRLLGAGGRRLEDLLIAVVPGAGQARKVWPWRRFSDVCSWLIDTYAAQIVLIGGEGDRDTAKQIVSQVGAEILDVTGALSLREVFALLQQCQLFIGNDTGSMHMAAAAGVPIIGVNGHALSAKVDHELSPLRFGPWRARSRIVRPSRSTPPCDAGCLAHAPHCILAVSVEDVTRAAATLLSEKAG
jgi:heptosyltransferase-2